MNREQAKPLYQIVANEIIAQIDRGDLKINDRLPPEADLIEYFKVGRNTVRRALSELVEQGVLITVHGVGTFVSDNLDRFPKTAEFLYGFSQELGESGAKVSSKVVDGKIILADALLSRRLGIQLGAEVVFLNRVRLMDLEPVAIERAYLPHELCPDILEYDFSSNSLYEILSNVYDRKPDHAEQQIEASLATPEVAELLELKHPAVILAFHRETRLADGQVIEYVDSELRADRFHFYANLRLRSFDANIVFRRMPVNVIKN